MLMINMNKIYHLLFVKKILFVLVFKIKIVTYWILDFKFILFINTFNCPYLSSIILQSVHEHFISK